MLPKVGIWATVTLNMANFYLPTKFDAYIFIGDRDMAKKSKMVDAAILNCQRVLFWSLNSPSAILDLIFSNLGPHTKFN